MRWTEVLQGLRRMRFEDIYGRWQERRLSQAEAAEILGMSERTFRRWRDRYDADGIEGLADLRLGRASARRVPVDQVNRVLTLYRERYRGFTVRHFHDKLRQHHGFGLSYSWTKLRLQAAGLIAKAPRRSAHRKKRPRRPLRGMMLHQDGSSHRWLEALDAQLDLIVTMDDATSEIYAAFLVEEEGTMSTFRALAEVIAERGLFCALYTDRGSHYCHTPKAGEKVAKEHLTQVGRALAQLGIEHIPAYSPEARGRSERAFGTLQDRLVKELALAGISTVDAANRFLREVYLPEHNARFAHAPEQTESAFIADRAGRVGLHRGPGRRPSRRSVRARTARGRQRQHRALPGHGLADPAEPAASPLRQGAGAGPRLSRRHAGHLPRAALPRPLSRRR